MSTSAERRHKKELKRKQHRQMLRTANANKPKNKGVTSWKELVSGVVGETAQLVPMFKEIEKFYDLRLKYLENQKTANPSPAIESALEDHIKFKDQIDQLRKTVRDMVGMSAALEDMESTREKTEYLFDHLETFNEGRNQFTSVMDQMKTMDEKLKSIITAVDNKPVPMDVPDDVFEMKTEQPQSDMNEKNTSEESGEATAQSVNPLTV